MRLRQDGKGAGVVYSDAVELISAGVLPRSEKFRLVVVVACPVLPSSIPDPPELIVCLVFIALALVCGGRVRWAFTWTGVCPARL